MKVLDEVLEMLSDGNWHELSELEKLGLAEFKAKLIAHFLVSYGFCEMSVGHNWIILKPAVRVFLEEMDKVE